MGFLDKAKAAANDLASQAQNAMNSSGSTGGVNPEKLYRDLGQIVFNEHAGKSDPSRREAADPRPADPARPAGPAHPRGAGWTAAAPRRQRRRGCGPAASTRLRRPAATCPGRRGAPATGAVGRVLGALRAG